MREAAAAPGRFRAFAQKVIIWGLLFKTTSRGVCHYLALSYVVVFNKYRPESQSLPRFSLLSPPKRSKISQTPPDRPSDRLAQTRVSGLSGACLAAAAAGS